MDNALQRLKSRLQLGTRMDLIAERVNGQPRQTRAAGIVGLVNMECYALIDNISGQLNRNAWPAAENVSWIDGHRVAIRHANGDEFTYSFASC